MAKFCTKCGKKLEEGKPCDCEKKVEVTIEKKEEKKEPKTEGFDIQDCFNSYLEILKNIFTKPVDTIKKFAIEENFILGLIAILINSFVSGIFVYCFVKEAFGSFTSGMGMYGLAFGMGVEIPFLRVVIYGTIFMIASFLMTALMIYVLAGSLFKDDMNFKRAVALVGTCSVFTAVTTLGCVILAFVSIELVAYVVFVAGILYFAHLYHGLVEITTFDRNKLAYVFTGTIAVTLFVVYYILPKILF